MSSPDTARGTVHLTGDCVTGLIMLALPSGKELVLDGPTPRNVLVQLNGLEVVVHGRRRTDRFRWPVQGVERFFIRARAGQPVHEGILRLEAGAVYIMLPDGRRASPPASPDTLPRANGMRAWFAGPIDRPTSAGVINPDFNFWCPEE